MLLSNHIHVVETAIQTADLDLVTLEQLKSTLLSFIKQQTLNIDVESNTDYFLEQYCQKLVIFVLFNRALSWVEMYSDERFIGSTPICSFQVVSDKLTRAQVLSWLIENSLEKIYRDLMSNNNHKHMILTNHFHKLSFVIEHELKNNLDNILSIMGAKGYMMTSSIAKIWEKINEEHG